MADTVLQPRSRHLVAVFSLLISSVGGLAPQTCRRMHHPNNAVAPAFSLAPARSSLLRSHRAPLHLHRGPCQQRGEWGGIGEQRWPGASRGQGVAVGEEQQPTGGNKSFVGSRGSGARGWRSEPNRRASVIMALHFPKPPKMPKPPPPPPPPPPTGVLSPEGGKSAGRGASPSSTPPAGSNGGSTLKDSASSSSRANAKGAAGAVAEGVVDVVPGLVAKTRNVSVGHGNATRTDLNGGKTVRRRRTTTTTTGGGGGGGKGARAPPGKSGTTPSSLPRKRRVAGATTSAGETRKLKRRPRSPTSGGAADGTPGVKALVVTDDMELADMMALVKDVLERLSETERELRRLRKEGSLAKPNRPEVRDRKFVIDTRAKMLGAAFAGAVAGMIVGWSVLPNLWLVGGVTGAVAFAALSRSSSGTAGSICSTCGIQVALIYKDIRDWWEQTVFLYKTGKLSYTYWRGFERYDQAWGLSTKYSETVAKLSKEALELDRQYKIRQKSLRAGKRLTNLSRKVGTSAAKEVTTFATSATGWGSNQLRQWGLLGDDPDAVEENPGVFGGLLKSKKRLAGGRGGSGGAKRRRPLGFSVVLDGVFGERSRSIYSAPPAGGTRKPGYRGDPVIPARIRHMFMTSKQIRDERLQKYRVGFMGMRLARSFDKDD